MSFPSLGNGSSAQAKNGPSATTRNGVDLDKNDLIKLLGVLEGELQAREIVIAVLKSEQIKHLIYPTYGLSKPGPQNPLTCLWQDVMGAYESKNPTDLNSVSNLQQVQAKLLENMISQNNELLSKVKEQCSACNCSQFSGLFNLEQMTRSEAKDEAERVLEAETKASSVLSHVRDRERQIVLLLLGERQRLLAKLKLERANCKKLLTALREEKMRNCEMVDGLEEESKRSLLMEEQIEIHNKQFIAHKQQCQSELTVLRDENSKQKLEIERLQVELEKLSTLSGGVRSQIVTSASGPPAARVAAPVVSPAQLAQRSVAQAPVKPVEDATARPPSRPAPPPVPPNKPALFRKPPHLTAGASPPLAPSQPAPAPSQTTSDPLDTEIKNFQSVFVAMKSSSTQQVTPAATGVASGVAADRNT